MNALVLLAIPAATGLASVLWAQITATSRLTMAGLNVLSYAAVLAIVAASDGPALPRAMPTLAPVLGYVGLSVVISLLWFAALPRAPIVTIALAEAAYPAFALLAARVLQGPTPLSWTTLVGAGLVMVGAPLIAMGGAP